MKHLSKVCDAADWFDPEMIAVIQEELQEVPYFHRKQWEFAMIFLALKRYGFLNGDKSGLSMGGGSERVLYAISQHVRKLFVTDLYEEETIWDCARAADPDQFIKSNKPFDVDDSKIKALRMDMRKLEFEENTFDFCYSSCAVEHIGEYEDFLNHLNEVYRVLKNDGIYVFTTEFHFGDETIPDTHNYVFSASYLNRLINDCKLIPLEQPNASITPNTINYPAPGNVNALLGRELPIIGSFPHLQLLRGKYPLTSIMLILKKSSQSSKERKLYFQGKEAARRFLENGIQDYRNFQNKSVLTIDPFSGMGKSRFFADHQQFFNSNTSSGKEDSTIFHTAYFWFGSGQIDFQLHAKISETENKEFGEIEIRVHRYATRVSQHIESVKTFKILINGRNELKKHFSIPVDDDYCYAIVGKMIAGNLQFSEIDIRCSNGIISN